jgi:hypothetical protein
VPLFGFCATSRPNSPRKHVQYKRFRVLLLEGNYIIPKKGCRGDEK